MANGGQIAVPLDIAQAFVRHCTGQAPNFTEESLAEASQELGGVTESAPLQADIASSSGAQLSSPEQSIPRTQEQGAEAKRVASTEFRRSSLARLMPQVSGNPFRGPRKQAAGAKDSVARIGTSSPRMHNNPMYDGDDPLAQQPMAPIRLRSVPALLVKSSSNAVDMSPLGLTPRTGSGLRTPLTPQGVPAP